MGVHDDHRRRVYERFLREGLAGFEEHNAMEFLLFLARPRGDTNPLAHALIDSAVVLKFIPQMCAYYLENKTSHKVPLTSVEEASAFFMPKFFARTQEAFYMAAVDDRRVLLRCVLISEGSANATAVSVAKVVSEALKCGATGVMLAHNHPRGITLPSSSDMAVTREIYRALRLVNIQLLEHLIFADNEFLSFVQSNYMDSIRQSVQD